MGIVETEIETELETLATTSTSFNARRR